jgi:hypothetical protein
MADNQLDLNEEQEAEAVVARIDEALTSIEDESRGVVVRKRSEVAEPNHGSVDALIELAISRDADMDKLERLIALKDQQEAKQAKAEFDRHFAEMQSALSRLGPAPRSKKGEKGMYAPIEVLSRHYSKTISDHGFAFRFYEEPIEDGRLEVFCDVSGYGHTRTNSKIMPVYEPEKSSGGRPIQNVLQAEGVRSTYGQRYAFIAAFGLVSEENDTDGEPDFSWLDGVKYAEYINAIEAQTTIEDARAAGRDAYKALEEQHDERGMAMITQVTTAHKKYLATKNGVDDANR